MEKNLLYFFSRWMITDSGSNLGHLEDTKARYIVPVDLNAFLQKNARILAGYAARVYPDRPEVAEAFEKQVMDLPKSFL